MALLYVSILQVYQGCVQQDKDEIPDGQRVNLVKKIYAPFTNDQLSTVRRQVLRHLPYVK